MVSSSKLIVCLNLSFFTKAAYAFSVVLTEAWPSRCWTSVIAAPRFNKRVAKVLRALCEDTSSNPARLKAASNALLFLMDLWPPNRPGNIYSLSINSLRFNRVLYFEDKPIMIISPQE